MAAVARSGARGRADVGGDPAKVTDVMLPSLNVTRDLFSTFMMDYRDNLRKLGRDRELFGITSNPETADADPDVG